MVSRNLFVMPIEEKPVLQCIIKLLISLILKVWISGYIKFFGNESVGTVNREAEFVYVQFFMFICGYEHNSYYSMNVVNTSIGPNRGCRWGSVWVCLNDFFNNCQFWVISKRWKTLNNGVFLCILAFEVQAARMFIDHIKFFACRKQAFCLQSCPLWLVYTIVFVQQNLLSRWEQKKGEFSEFSFIVNSTHLGIFFWNGTPNFQYQKIGKKK